LRQRQQLSGTVSLPGTAGGTTDASSAWAAGWAKVSLVLLLRGTAEYYERVAQSFSIPLEGSVVKDVLYDGSLKSDAIHPTAAGYRRMAAAIARLLRGAGAI
jgi:lysophospholipase L1-like esterase